MFQFRKDSQKYRNECKNCKKKYNQQYFKNNKEKLLKNNREYSRIYYSKEENIQKRKDYNRMLKNIERLERILRGRTMRMLRTRENQSRLSEL